MLILLSPSKKQDFKFENYCTDFSYPIFQDKSSIIASILKQFLPDDLSKLMSISNDLAQLNYNRYQNFESNDQQLKQAILAFKGDVYAFLEFSKYQNKHYQFMQNHFLILSGLYGILKPLDLIKPYRLEMGTALKIHGNRNLYELWQEDITNFLKKSLNKNEVIINLASNEYFSVINVKEITNRIISISFKEDRNQQLKTIALNAKRARSMMSNYIIQNTLTNHEELKKFDINGYKFSADHSTNNNFVFIRKL